MDRKQELGKRPEALHDFPELKMPEHVTDRNLVQLVGNSQHIRSIAVAWLLGLATTSRKRSAKVFDACFLHLRHGQPFIFGFVGRQPFHVENNVQVPK